MRGRKPGLLPLELAILEAGTAFARESSAEFHGFRMSEYLREASGAALFTTHGALYKALDRMERRGYLVSRWEEPDIALSAGRPRRRLYRITAVGEAALVASRSSPGVVLQQVPQR